MVNIIVVAVYAEYRGPAVRKEEKYDPYKSGGNGMGTLVDERDGHVYKTVKIGGQIWMAENLNYKTAGSYCYEYKESNCSKYGRLYRGKMIISDDHLCPDGWDLPADYEFGALFHIVGGEEVAGKKLKSKNGWNKNGNGTDEFSFSVLPVGAMDDHSDFGSMGRYAGFWIGSFYNSGLIDMISFDYVSNYVTIDYLSEYFGLSVRCIKKY